MLQGNKGYIKIHRQLTDSWIWNNSEPFDMRSAWIDLLLMVNHDDNKILYEGKIITIHKGQVLTSILKLSAKWRWSRKKTARFLDILEKDNMITKKVTTHGTTITLINWDKYQVRGTTEEQQRNIKGTTEEQQRNINNNDKNVKNDKEIYNAQFQKFWETYPRKVDKKRAYKCYTARVKEGFSEEDMLKAAENYAKECKNVNRDSQYIKHPATFLSVDTPFMDYVNGVSIKPKQDVPQRDNEDKLKALEDRFLRRG